jgi:hypothetical protein
LPNIKTICEKTYKKGVFYLLTALRVLKNKASSVKMRWCIFFSVFVDYFMFSIENDW